MKPKHALFLKTYLTNGRNSAAAARAAGYSERSAPQTGSALLKHPDIAGELARLTTKTQKKLELTAALVMEELTNLVSFDPAKMYGEDGKLLPVNKMPVETRKAIAGIDEDLLKGTKVRLSSRLGSLELASKLLGMIREQQQVSANVTILVAERPELPVVTQDAPKLRPEW